MRKYLISELIAILIAAATALKADGLELVIDPSTDTKYITQDIAKAYTVSTALGEWYGDGQGKWAGGGQSTLDKPINSDGSIRTGWKGREDSHGPWQQNMHTWIRLEELDETLETLKNAPRFEGLGMDDIRELITNDPEEAAYAYLYTINIDRFAKKVKKTPITGDMDTKEVLKTLDTIYSDWGSTSLERSKSYENVLNHTTSTTTTTLPTTTTTEPTTTTTEPTTTTDTTEPTTTTVPRPPSQKPKPPNRVFPQRPTVEPPNRVIPQRPQPEVDKMSKKRVTQMLEAQINKQRKEKGYEAMPVVPGVSPPVQNKVSEELKKAIELLRGR